MMEPRRADYAWAALAVVMLLLLLLAIFNAVWSAAAEGEWWGLLALPLSVLFYWWIGVGSWQRTTWGRNPSSS